MRQINQETDDIIQYKEYNLPLQIMMTLKQWEEFLKDLFANKLVKCNVYSIALFTYA